MNSDEVEKRARELSTEGRFIEAADLLREGIKHAPWTDDLRVGLIMTLGFSKEYTQVVMEFKKLKNIASVEPQAIIMTARAYRNLGLHDTAIEMLDDAIKERRLDPDDAFEATVELSHLVRRTKMKEKVLKIGNAVSKEILKSYPKVPQANFVYGYWLTVKEKNREAIAYFKYAAESSPERMCYWSFLGDTYMKLKDKKSAAKAWANLAADGFKSEDDIDTLDTMCDLFEKEGYKEEWFRCADRIIKLCAEDTIEDEIDNFFTNQEE